MHHTMIIYAGSGSFLYIEGRQDDITDALGGWFCAVNQAYFMSLFLLISAYFVPGSYDRKGAGHFLKDRLIRLGIPLIIYSWIISPLTWCRHLCDARPDPAVVDLSAGRSAGCVHRRRAAVVCGSPAHLLTGVCGCGDGSSGPIRPCRQSTLPARFPATRRLCCLPC